jgi:hypothetical protein
MLCFQNLYAEKQDETQVSSARSLIRKAREFVKYGSPDSGNSFYRIQCLKKW